jgi:hypothetical protein
MLRRAFGVPGGPARRRAQYFSGCPQDVSLLQATHMLACYHVQNRCHHERAQGRRPVTANAT